MEFWGAIYSWIDFLAKEQFLSPLVLFLSVFFSYKGIVKTIRSNRKNMKDRATISYIMERNSDDEFTEGLKIILEIDRDDNQDIKKFAKKDHRVSEEATKIRHIANHYEYLAVGIVNDIYNEKMLKKSSKGTTIRIHKALEKYITEIRRERKSNTIYENFDHLAGRWEKEDS